MEYLQLHDGHVVLHHGVGPDPGSGRHRGLRPLSSHPVVDGGWEGLTLAFQREVSSNASSLQLTGNCHHGRD